MLIRRSVLCFLVGAAAVGALYRAVYLPWSCNTTERQVIESTDRILAASDPFTFRRSAERNLVLLERCRKACPTDVQLATLAAANLMVLGRAPAAAAMYKGALQYDRRPEIYLDLAEAQLAAGDRAAAVQSLIHAGDFAGKDYVLKSRDVVARMQAYEVVAQREARAAASIRGKSVVPNLVFNGDFATAGSQGPVASNGGRAGISRSAAESWSTWADTATPVVTQLVASSRRPGGTMLRVTTGAANSGIFQAWSERRGFAPPSTRTVTWVFVRRGQVGVGTGYGSKTYPGSYSTTTGRWERLESDNTSCPATQTIVFAANAGADFDIDSIEVKDVPGPPCEQNH